MKRIVLSTCLFIFSIFLASNCTPQNIDTTEEARTAIEASNKIWMTAFENGDAKSIAELYSENAKFLLSHGPTVIGKENIQNQFQGMIDAGITVKLEIVEVEAQGNLAYEVGNAPVFGPDGQQIDDSKYIVVWKKIDNSWKMHKDIYNSNNPLPVPEAEN